MAAMQGLWICTPTPLHNTFGLQMYFENEKLLEKVEDLCWQRLIFDEEVKNQLGTFVQGQDRAWIYYEFLNTHPPCPDRLQKDILKIAPEIADELGLELDIR